MSRRGWPRQFFSWLDHGLLEPGWVASAPAHDLGLGFTEIDHGGGLGAAVARVEDRVYRVVESLLDLPSLGQGLGSSGSSRVDESSGSPSSASSACTTVCCGIRTPTVFVGRSSRRGTSLVAGRMNV